MRQDLPALSDIKKALAVRVRQETDVPLPVLPEGFQEKGRPAHAHSSNALF